MGVCVMCRGRMLSLPHLPGLARCLDSHITYYRIMCMLSIVGSIIEGDDSDR